MAESKPKPIDPEITLARAKLQLGKIFETADALRSATLRAQAMGLSAHLTLLGKHFK